MNTPALTPNQKRILVALASHKGVATVHQLVSDTDLNLIDVYRSLVALELSQFVSHSGIASECAEVTRCFKKWSLDQRVPQSKGVAFCLTEGGLRLVQSLLLKKSAP